MLGQLSLGLYCLWNSEEEARRQSSLGASTSSSSRGKTSEIEEETQLRRTRDDKRPQVGRRLEEPTQQQNLNELISSGPDPGSSGINGARTRLTIQISCTHACMLHKGYIDKAITRYVPAHWSSAWSSPEIHDRVTQTYKIPMTPLCEQHMYYIHRRCCFSRVICTRVDEHAAG